MGWAWDGRGIDRCGAVSGAEYAWNGRGMGVGYSVAQCGGLNTRGMGMGEAWDRQVWRSVGGRCVGWAWNGRGIYR